MAEKYWRLQCCQLFERLKLDELDRLEATSSVRKFRKGTPVYLPTDRSHHVMLLIEGRVKLCSFTDEGKQAILAFIEPGELFGEFALLTGGPREEYAESVEASTVAAIPAEAIDDLMQRYPDLSLGVTKLIGLRRRRIERRLKYLLFRSNRDRLIHLLLELAEQYGVEEPEGVRLKIQLSHQDLASVIGSTRETVTLVLGELQNEGWIKMGRRKLTLLDAAGLAESIAPRSTVDPPAPQAVESN